MNRREAIKLVATASVALWTPEEAASARAKAAAVLSQSAAGVPFQPEFFSTHEYDTVRLLVDLVIPADDRSGSATEAGVPEFMDFMMIDRPTMQEWMRGGLAWLDIESHRRFDVRFLDATDGQRVEILEKRYDAVLVIEKVWRVRNLAFSRPELLGAVSDAIA